MRSPKPIGANQSRLNHLDRPTRNIGAVSPLIQQRTGPGLGIDGLLSAGGKLSPKLLERIRRDLGGARGREVTRGMAATSLVVGDHAETVLSEKLLP